MANRKDRTQALAARSRFWIDDLHVQPDRLLVMRGEEEIKLERRMMEVLVELAHHGKKPVSKDALLGEFWSDEDGNELATESALTKAMSTLRDKIGDDARNPRYIRTVSGQGYCIIPKVLYPKGYRQLPGDFGTWTRGNPYVGLRSFDERHADVFQGRSQTVADLMAAMRKQIDNERRFVLIVGPSGCGKTSLVRASMIPTVSRQCGPDGLRALSVAACDLGTASDGDVMTTLAASLTAWTLGEQEVFALHPEDLLREILVEAPEKVCAIIEESFRRCPVRGIDEQPYAHLLLTIDHAEALVAGRNIRPEQTASFDRAIRALCDTPHILTTMTARLDFYPALSNALPELAAYRSGHGHFEVSTPKGGELAKIIRKPAALAGVDFEEHPITEKFLDDLLYQETIAQPDALPLLQHTLHALYERCIETRQLTYAAYDEIGGLEGAIARRAEEVFGRLPTATPGDLDRTLGRVLARLVVIQPDSDSVSASPIVRDRLDPEAEHLVQAFIDAHLFVSDLDGGQPIARVAHEALLRQWPRAAEWIEENRRLLQAKSRLQRAAERWDEDERNADHLLNSGRPLSEAEEAIKALGNELGEKERDFLHASQRVHQKKRLLKRIALLFLTALAIMTTFMATYSMHLKSKADENRRRAVDQVGFTLVELADELRPTASIQTLDRISTHAIDLLSALPAEKMDVDDLINYSRALRIRGEVLHAKRDAKDALSMFKLADKIAQRAVRMNGNSEKAIFEAGQTAYWLGYWELNQGNQQKAKLQWERYAEFARSLDSENPEWLREQAFAGANLARLELDSLGCQVASGKFSASIDSLKEAVESQREKLSWKYDLIVLHSWLSRCHSEDGKVIAAAIEYDKQIADLREINRKSPAAIDWEHQLTSLLHLRGLISMHQNDYAHALELFLEAIERLKIIMRLQPDNTQWKLDLAKALVTAGEIATRLQDMDLATDLLDEADQIIGNPHTPGEDVTWFRLHARARFWRGASSKDETIMNSAISDLSSLAQTSNDRRVKVDLSNALVFRGQWLKANDRADEARTDWNLAKSTMHSIATSTRDPDLLAPWLNAHRMLGENDQIIHILRDLHSSGYISQN